MSPTNDQTSKDNELDPPNDNGDTYDEDTGEFLGNIKPLDGSLPAQLAYYRDGYWYVYKIYSKYKKEEENEAEDTGETVHQEAVTAFADPNKSEFADPSTDITLP